MNDDHTIIEGGDDVFTDLGYPAAHGFKAALVTRLRKAMEDRGLNQSQAAKLVGVSQADLSRLLGGKFRNVSVERLMALLTRLDLDVEVTVRRKGEADGETIHYAPA